MLSRAMEAVEFMKWGSRMGEIFRVISIESQGEFSALRISVAFDHEIVRNCITAAPIF